MDFSLSPAQADLRAKARAFAKSRLSEVPALLAKESTPETRFRATRPVYEDLVREGFLARLVPVPFGGGGTGVVDMAVVALDCAVHIAEGRAARRAVQQRTRRQRQFRRA